MSIDKTLIKFNQVDQDGDIFLPDCFDNTKNIFVSNGFSNEIKDIIYKTDILVNENEAIVENDIDLPNEDQLAYSIGFTVLDYEVKDDLIRVIKKMKLNQIAIIPKHLKP